MRILVTGSAGHLGEGLMRVLAKGPHEAIGIDILASPWTTHVGSIASRAFVAKAIRGCDAVLHTATLHKPHVATHSRQDFIETNITGTLNLLEEAVAAGVSAFVFTSTTSAFGDALTPPDGAPAAWITEDVMPKPKNIYGVTKTAAEDLCRLFHRNSALPIVILRTSRFFPEDDDSAAARAAFDQTNLKVNELTYRRVDVADVVDAHLLAIERAPAIGFGRYIISATTVFKPEDLPRLRGQAPEVLSERLPAYSATYAAKGWKMLNTIDRIYVNDAARRDLGWQPTYDFPHAIEALMKGKSPFSDLARAIGVKGYHAETFEGMPFPVEP